MKNVDLKVSNDVVFQMIFGKVGNENITKNLLEKILQIKIKQISLDRNKRMQLDTLNDKIGRLDIKAELDDGTIVHIEMQSREYNFMEERFIYYNDILFRENILKGSGYSRANKVIGILIVDYNLKSTQNIPKYHTVWNYREKDYPENILVQNKEIHIIDLKKFEQYGESDKELAEWIKFLKIKEMQDMADIEAFNEWLAKAKEELEFLSKNNEAQAKYREREDALRDYIDEIEYRTDKAKKEGEARGRAEGRAEGEAKGRAEGEAKKQIEIAKNLLKMGLSTEQIMEATGLSKEGIENLK